MTSATSSYSEQEDREEPILSKIGLLRIALLMLVIGTVWRIVDIFAFQLGETPMNILPSKLGPLLVILLVFWRYRPNEISTVLGLSKKDFRPQLILGTIIGFTIILSVNFLGPLIFHLLFDSTYPLDIHVVYPELFLYLLIFFLINAVFEEILFRGILQNGLINRFSFPRALLIQSIIFGIWHAVWPIANGPTSDTFIQESLSVVVLSGLIGGFFGIYYEKFSHRRTLIGPIVAHTIFNFINESFKVGPAPQVQGPDFSFTEPALMIISLLIFMVVFCSMIVLALKYRIEDVINLRNRVSLLLRRI
ncbi:MAG: conserved membrane protein of unknown function [Candidatus Thorarchaeota archaeon]|nr:MAG: conserved membrane protein of unknown function [Candidatus Thorarchaeota archaeon]